ncbi:hypothetical protein ACROYT_G040639 [Oculina patagonica]
MQSEAGCCLIGSITIRCFGGMSMHSSLKRQLDMWISQSGFPPIRMSPAQTVQATQVIFQNKGCERMSLKATNEVKLVNKNDTFCPYDSNTPSEHEPPLTPRGGWTAACKASWSKLSFNSFKLNCQRVQISIQWKPFLQLVMNAELFQNSHISVLL